MGHTCDTCSGTKFETVDGYYYCQECGTQSQYQQVEMEADVVMVGDRTIGGETVVLKKEKNQDTRITSWEEFNYILVGLVDELINLGANNRFKKTVLKLWTKYLQSIEASFFSLDDECLPRLPAKFQKRDAEILYNKHHRKRNRARRGSCSSMDSGDTKSSGGKADSVIKSFNISKVIKQTKEQLARAQYEDYKKLNEDSSSVATSLATSSQRSDDKKSQVSLNLNFTREARRIFKRKKKMPKQHIKSHQSDHEDALDCHHNNLRELSSDKVESLDNRLLIGILLLGLNLSQDDMQASDLIRFLREGHLSNYNIQHFLPENIKSESVLNNFDDLKKTGIYNHSKLRFLTARLIRDMSIPELIPPNLVTLVHRYIDELCLPEEMKVIVEKFMAYHPSRMEFTRDSESRMLVPNYDGRAMAYILFVLKLIFGLDDEREAKISDSARDVNNLLSESHPELHLFVIDDWLKMLRVRQLVIEKYHFPSAIQNQWKDFGAMPKGVGNWQMYVEHLKTVHESKMTVDRKITSGYDTLGVAKNTLVLLNGLSEKKRQEGKEQDQANDNYSSTDEEKLCQKGFTFRPSMTPFKDYTKVLLEENCKMQPLISKPNEVYLSQDFSFASLQPFYEDKFMIKRLKAALKQQGDLKLKVTELGLNSRPLLMVQPNRFLDNRNKKQDKCQVEYVSKEEADQLRDFKPKRKGKVEEQLIMPGKVEDQGSPSKDGEIGLHISNMDYWVHHLSNPSALKPFGVHAHTEELKILPNNFKFLWFECARIVEQDPKFLMVELALLERVLIYERSRMEKPKGYAKPPRLSMW